MGSFFRPRRRLTGTRVIITGASSGIGRSLAIELAACDARQVLMARDAAKLQDTAAAVAERGSQAVVVAGDVTDAGVRAEALRRASEAYGGLDLLVNNAGVGAYGRFVEVGPDRLRRLAEVNLVAPGEFIREATPLLRAADDTAVVNIGSILGCRGLPFSSEYCATKFALHGLSESIRPELARLGVGLLVVAPGTTATGFKDNVVDNRGKPPWGRRGSVPPERVARATLAALRRRRRFIIPNTQGWAMVTANRFAPWLLDRVIDRYG
ncbi:MAG: SDR family NAD(P)-dependent oxidoreductase [Planctomycetota bacterium]